MTPAQGKADLATLKALEYIVKIKAGYLADLKSTPYFTEDKINEFCSMRFMHIGNSATGQTWGVSPFAREFYAVVR